MWLVDETKKNLPKELDFLHEAQNAEMLRKLFKDYKSLHIPKIYFDLSSEKVLTMEFCDGAQINDIDFFRNNNIDTHDLCKRLGRIYSDMIFKFGFIHADPHPGNILVQKIKDKVTIVLLDHGLYSVSVFFLFADFRKSSKEIKNRESLFQSNFFSGFATLFLFLKYHF
jgi:aarF domain-containing kinase